MNPVDTAEVIWRPSAERVARAPITFAEDVAMGQWSADEVEACGATMVEYLDIPLQGERTPVLAEDSMPGARWFPNTRTNDVSQISKHALRREVPLQTDLQPFDHPLWVVYSSGITGLPKPIVHCHGGILVEHVKTMALHNDVAAGDRFHCYTTTGWVMWNLNVAALLVGAIIYGRSDATISRHGVRRHQRGIPRGRGTARGDGQSGGRPGVPGPRKLNAAVRAAAAGARARRPADRAHQVGHPRGLSVRHVLHDVIAVAEVPRTLTGKKLEVPMKKLLLGQPADKVAHRDAMAQPRQPEPVRGAGAPASPAGGSPLKENSQ